MLFFFFNGVLKDAILLPKTRSSVFYNDLVLLANVANPYFFSEVCVYSKSNHFNDFIVSERPIWAPVNPPVIAGKAQEFPLTVV